MPLLNDGLDEIGKDCGTGFYVDDKLLFVNGTHYIIIVMTIMRVKQIANVVVVGKQL
jgi:hypothetical protein